MRLKIASLMIISLLLGGCYTIVLTPDDVYDPDPYGLYPDPAQGSSLGSSAPYWDPWWEPYNPYTGSVITSFYDPGYYYYSYDPYAQQNYYSPIYVPIGTGREADPQAARGVNRDDPQSLAPRHDRKPPTLPSSLPTLPPAQDGGTASQAPVKDSAPTDPPKDSEPVVTPAAPVIKQVPVYSSPPKKDSGSDKKKSRNSRSSSSSRSRRR